MTARAKTLRSRVTHVWRKRSHLIVRTVTASLVLSAIALFTALAGQVQSGATRQWDERVLTALRKPDAPAEPLGPAWLHGAALDVTALGSPLVLTFFVIASVGFLYFEGQRRVALTAVLTISGGALLSGILKHVFARPRPDIVPHLRDVGGLSFPSGHSMGAAIVYFTLGVMFTKAFKSRRAKAFCLAWAFFLATVVGLSRVFLGVHYPSDVLAGWLAGLGWALACHAVAQFIPTRPVPEVSDTPRA
jgi:undecaprenyl-diphosphatase